MQHLEQNPTPDATRRRTARWPGSIVAAVGLAASLIALVASPAAAATTVSGTVMCVSQKNVVGVWIQAERGGSGWARRSNINGYTQRYSYSLPNGGRYQVHVGCGGTSQNWATDNKSGYVSGTYNNFTCYDTTAAYYYYKTCQRT